MSSDPTPSDVPPIDFEHLRRYTMGDANLEQEILGLFLSHVPKSLQTLKDAATATEWRAAAHGIKGSARAVGAHAVADLAVRAEAAFPENQQDRDGQLAAMAEAVATVTRYVDGLAAPAKA